MRLVEEPPWTTPALSDRLREVQDRLYSAVDVAIDGLLVDKFPEAKGLGVRVQLDCVDPPTELFEFVARFRHHLATDPQYSEAIQQALPGLEIVANRLSSPA